MPATFQPGARVSHGLCTAQEEMRRRISYRWRCSLAGPWPRSARSISAVWLPSTFWSFAAASDDEACSPDAACQLGGRLITAVKPSRKLNEKLRPRRSPPIKFTARRWIILGIHAHQGSWATRAHGLRW